MLLMPSDRRLIKCVAWDLDDTLWEGVLLEDSAVRLREGAVEVVKTLDGRGILQSIVSKNDYKVAMAKLHELNLNEYFLYPQINWNSKSSSIQNIAEAFNIGLDAIALIDDQPVEREEVRFTLPDVLCIDSGDLNALLARPELNPPFASEEMNERRLMYLASARRLEAEDKYEGPKEAFLAGLEMRLNIYAAKEDDLARAQELTVRTHQLNTTGYTYSDAQLRSFIKSEKHRLLMASLKDKYGNYGKIGLALIELQRSIYTIKLLLMSCRVMSTGVGTLLLYQIMNIARQDNVTLRAEFIPNHRNRMMYIAYTFAGFKEVERMGDVIILENPLTAIPPCPDYAKVEVL